VTGPEARGARTGPDAAEPPLDLIHTNNSPKRALARVSGPSKVCGLACVAAGCGLRCRHSKVKGVYAKTT
jgi:hypothetical protein